MKRASVLFLRGCGSAAAVVAVCMVLLFCALPAAAAPKKADTNKDTAQQPATEDPDAVDDALVDEFMADDEDIEVDDSLEEDTDWEDDPPDTPPEYTYNLDQVIAMALANSHSLKAASIGVKVANSRVTEAWGVWVPKISVLALVAPAPSYERPTDTSIKDFMGFSSSKWDLDSVTFRTEATAKMPLFHFGRNLSDMAQADLGVEKARLEVLKTKADIIYQAKQAYYAMQFVNKLISILDEGLDVATSTRKKLVTMLEEGSSDTVSKIDLYKLDVLIGEVKNQLSDARSKRELLMAAVRVLAGLPPNAPFYLAAPELRRTDTSIMPYQNYLDYAFSLRPEVRSLDIEARLKNMQRLRKLWNMLPVLDLKADFHYQVTPKAWDSNNPYLSDDWNDINARIKLEMRWTLDPMVDAGKYLIGKYRMLKFAEERKHKRLGMALEVRKSYETLREKDYALGVNKESLQAGKSWLLAEVMNYSVGITDTDDVIEAIAGYAKTQVYYYQALFDFNSAAAQLEMVTGATTQAPAPGKSVEQLVPSLP